MATLYPPYIIERSSRGERTYDIFSRLLMDRIVFLGAAPNLPADQLRSRTLFIVARDDANSDGPRLPSIRAQYLKAPEPKELTVLDGDAHAQFLFQTDQANRVMDQIVRFLSVP